MIFNADNAMSRATLFLFSVLSGIFWHYALAAYAWAVDQPDLVAVFTGLSETVKFVLVILVTIGIFLYLHLRPILAERKRIFDSDFARAQRDTHRVFRWFVYHYSELTIFDGRQPTGYLIHVIKTHLDFDDFQKEISDFSKAHLSYLNGQCSTFMTQEERDEQFWMVQNVAKHLNPNIGGKFHTGAYYTGVRFYQECLAEIIEEDKSARKQRK